MSKKKNWKDTGVQEKPLKAGRVFGAKQVLSDQERQRQVEENDVLETQRSC